MTQKLDHRTRYTRSVIKQSFLELLQKYPFPKVTVTAICKRRKLHGLRSTCIIWISMPC